MDSSEKKVKTTPKDFFLYLGVMIALYASVVALLSLLFGYINILFPDALDFSFRVDSYNSQVRFSIASLIILFPLYVFLTRLVNQGVRRNPEKKELWVRKWLVYLTLFIAGATIAGDLIALINTFLNGEVTTRFILKVLAVLVVIGAVFEYYFFDLKGKWEKQEHLSRTIGWFVGIVVLALIGAGFFVVGSPQSQRLVRFDEEKVRDLQTIQSQVVTFWQQKEALPGQLEDLEDSITGFRVPVDPQTQEPYTYQVVADLTFELCANFNMASIQSAEGRPISRFEGDFFGLDSNWEHKAGDTCFERVIDPDRFPVKGSDGLLHIPAEG